MENIIKTYINWDKYDKLCVTLIESVKSVQGITDIIAIPRGGYIPAQCIAHALGISRVYSMGISFYDAITPGVRRKEPIFYQDIIRNFSGSKALIVDVVDSGDTLNVVKNRITQLGGKEILVATLVLKSGNPVPDFWSMQVPREEWVVFPYEQE